MSTIQSSAVLAAARQSVWTELSAVERWPLWLPTVTSVEPLDGHVLRLGARYRVVQPGLRPAIWTVTVVEPRRRFAWEIRSPGLRVLADHLIDETSPGHSAVTLRVSFSGWMGAIVGRLTRATTERYLAQETNALQQRFEALHVGKARDDPQGAHAS